MGFKFTKFEFPPFCDLKFPIRKKIFMLNINIIRNLFFNDNTIMVFTNFWITQKKFSKAFSYNDHNWNGYNIIYYIHNAFKLKPIYILSF